MKVYVDELPKSCAECEFCGRLKPPAERPEIECMHCNMAKTFNSISPFCPLQSLADHDKKVRAEVVAENQALKERWEKLKEFIKEHLQYDKEELSTEKNLPNRFYITAEEMILEKMQELEKE